MGPQNRRGGLGIDVSLETGLNCRCLAGIGHDANDLLGFQNLAYGHRNGTPGDFGNICKPPLADLLAPAILIEFHDQIWLIAFEIRGRVIEGQVPVLPNPHESDIDGSRT